MIPLKHGHFSLASDRKGGIDRNEMTLFCLKAWTESIGCFLPANKLFLGTNVKEKKKKDKQKDDLILLIPPHFSLL